jgi:hypothetical protein
MIWTVRDVQDFNFHAVPRAWNPYRQLELGNAAAPCQRVFQFRFQLGKRNPLCVNIAEFVVKGRIPVSLPNPG